MKIFYIKQTLFDSSYRCAMVRKRLLQQIDDKQPNILVISGCQNKDNRVFNDLLKNVRQSGLTIISKNGKHRFDNQKLSLSNTHLLLNNRLISPIEGCVCEVNSNPFSLNYIVLDIFADEQFSDYHGELDEGLTQELNSLLSNSIK